MSFKLEENLTEKTKNGDKEKITLGQEYRRSFDEIQTAWICLQVMRCLVTIFADDLRKWQHVVNKLRTWRLIVVLIWFAIVISKLKEISKNGNQRTLFIHSIEI